MIFSNTFMLHVKVISFQCPFIYSNFEKCINYILVI